MNYDYDSIKDSKGLDDNEYADEDSSTDKTNATVTSEIVDKNVNSSNPGK